MSLSFWWQCQSKSRMSKIAFKSYIVTHHSPKHIPSLIAPFGSDSDRDSIKLSFAIYLFSLLSFSRIFDSVHVPRKNYALALSSVLVLNSDSLFIHSFIHWMLLLFLFSFYAVLCMRWASRDSSCDVAQLMSLYVNLCNFRFSASIFQ